METKHFQIRSQQRRIPKGGQWLLDEFGVTQYDGAGHRIVSMNAKSKRKMEREFGSALVAKMGSLCNVYRVESSSGDVQITTGYRRDRIRRH